MSESNTPNAGPPANTTAEGSAAAAPAGGAVVPLDAAPPGGAATPVAAAAAGTPVPVAIIALELTSTSHASDASFHRAEGKSNGRLCGAHYLYVKKGDGDGITELRVSHDDKSPGDGFVQLTENLTKTAGKFVYIWYKTKTESSPIVDLKIISADEPAGPGFSRISEELNPEATGATPKEYLVYKTRAAEVKLQSRDFKVGDALDANDTSHQWLAARVIEVDAKEEKVKIHYEGWDAKWDEWIHKRSPRLAPAGMHSSGMGRGGSRAPFNLFAELDAFKKTIKRTEAVVALLDAKRKEVLPKLSAETDEKIRSALAASLTLAGALPKDELSFVQVDDNFKFVMNILNAIVDDGKLFVFTQTFLQRNLDILIHALKYDAELHLSAQNTFQLLMCADPQFNRYYREYGGAVDDKDPEAKETHAIRGPLSEKPDDLPSIYLIANINYFGQHGGFEALAARFTKPQFKDSFVCTAKLIRSLAVIRPTLERKFAEGFVSALNLPALTEQRLAKVTDEDLKTLDKEQLAQLSVHVQGLLSLIMPPEKLAEFGERSNLSIALRLVNSGVLAKRLDGAQQLEAFLVALRRAGQPPVAAADPAAAAAAALAPGGVGPNAAPPGAVAAAVVPPPTQFITAPVMVKWLEDNKVLDSFLSKDSHEQVIRRSPPILKFLSSQGALQPHHVTLLWGAGVGKAESVVRVVYDTLADLSQELSEGHLDELFTRIQEKKITDYRDYDMKFVRDFTLNAVRTTKTPNKWYGLDIFWQILQIGDAVEAPVAAMAAGILTNLLAAPVFAAQLCVYLDKCIKLLKTGPSGAVVTALKLGQLIIEVGAPDPTTHVKLNKEETLVRLEKENRLVDAVLADFVRYAGDAAKALAADSKLADSKDPVIAGHPHSTHVTTRFDFLDFIFGNSEIKFEQKSIDTIWNTFVVKPVHQFDRARALSWLSKAVIKPDSKGKPFLAALSGYIFTELLSNEKKMSYDTLTIPGWECFESFFSQINSTAGALLVSMKVPVVVVSHAKLVGLDALWSIVCRASNVDVAHRSIQFLTTLYVRLEWSLPTAEKKAVIKGFVDRLMATLRASAQEKKKLIESKDAKTDDKPLMHRMTQLLVALVEYLSKVSTELIPKPKFKVGEKIHATWQRQQQKYNAEVKAVNRDGTYFVLYGDGDKDEACPIGNMFKVELPADPAAPPPEKEDEDDTPELSGYARVLLSTDQHHFDLLFDVLGFGGDPSKVVIKLLAQLPTNKGLSDTVKNLTTTKAAVDWNQLLPKDSIMKLKYTLGIVKSNVVIPAIAPAAAVVEGGAPDPAELKRVADAQAPYQEWSDMFLSKGGFNHLANIVLTCKPAEMLANPQTQECMFALLELLNYFIGSPHLSKQSNPYLDHEKSVRFMLMLLEQILAIQGPEEKRKSKNTPVNAEQEAERLMHSYLVAYTLHAVYLSAIYNNKLLTDLIFKTGSGAGNWDVILLTGLLHRSSFIRKSMNVGLTSMCGFEAAHSYLLPKLLASIGSINTELHSPVCGDYFELIQGLLKIHQTPAAPASDSKDGKSAPGAAVVPTRAPLFDPKKLATDLCEKIKNHPVLESSAATVDFMLCGLFHLAQTLLGQTPALKEPLGQGGLIEDVLKCLFDVPTGSRNSAHAQPPRCKSVHSRNLAYQLLAELAIGSPANTRKVLAAVGPYHVLTHSGQKRSDEWMFEARGGSEEKSSTGYLGLVNLGCICYMNSNIQQLFMIPKLRANILSIDTFKPDEDLKENMVYQLQQVFGTLQESEKVAANPAGFVHTYKGDDGKPVDPRIQEDSAGFFQKTLDRIEMAVKGTRYANAIRDVMGGFTVTQKIGRGPCTHVTEREEPMYGLQVIVKDKKNLEEGLNNFITGEQMDAVNCDACGKRVPILKRDCFRKLPPTMVFLLKRFDINFETMDMIKLNSRFEFPQKISLKPFCAETLGIPKTHTYYIPPAAKPPAPKPAAATDGKAGAPAKGGDGKAAPAAAPVAAPVTPAVEEPKPVHVDVKHPDEYYEYELRGMVIHTGSLHGGHYYSFIQERLEGEQEGKWYEFNDTRVSPFDPKNIADEAFGGTEEAPRYMQRPGAAGASPTVVNYGGMGSDAGATTGGYEKSRNAYILYYDRVKAKLGDAPTPAAAAAGDSKGADSKGADGKDSGKAELSSMKAAGRMMQVVVKQRKAARLLRQRAELPPKMMQEIWAQNTIHWRDRAVFDRAYFEFLWNVVNRVPYPEAIVPAGSDEKTRLAAAAKLTLALPAKVNPADHVAAGMVATRFVLQTLSRSREKETQINLWLQRLKRLYESDVSLGLWFLEELFNPEFAWAHDFLLNCPEEGIRNTLADIIGKVLSLVSAKEQAALTPAGVKIVKEDIIIKSKDGKEDQKATRDVRTATGYATRFICKMIEMLTSVPQYFRSFDPYFRVLSQFAGLGTAEAQYLVREHNLLARLIDLFVGEKSSHPEVNPGAVDPKGRRVQMAEEGGYRVDLSGMLVLLKQLVLVCAAPRLDAAAATAAADAKSAPAAAPAGKSSPFSAVSAGNAPLALNKESVDLLLGSEKGEFLSKLLALATSARKGKAVGAIVCHLVWENDAVSELILKTINRVLNETDYVEARPLFRTVMKLVLLKDSIALKRVDSYMDQFIATVHAQSKFWKVTDLCLEHLIRMAKRVDRIKGWLLEHPKLLDNMIGWIHTYAEPPAQVPAYMRDRAEQPEAAIVLLKPAPERSYNSAASMVASMYSAIGSAAAMMMARGGGGAAERDENVDKPSGLAPAKKEEALNAIKAGTALADEAATDSDIDFSERTFKLMEFVDVRDSVNKWLVAQIVRIDGNRVEIHFDGWPDKWNETLDVSDPRIRTLGSFCTKQQIDDIGKAPPPKAA